MSRPARAYHTVSLRSAGRTSPNITPAKTAVSAMMRSTSSGPLPATTATTNASNVQAMMSSTAAQANANTPVDVRCMPRSVRMRASTGKAVIDIATPRNSARASGGTGPSAVSSWLGYSSNAKPAPNAKGSTTDDAEMVPASFSRPRISSMSRSRPTMNMNSTRPS